MDNNMLCFMHLWCRSTLVQKRRTTKKGWKGESWNKQNEMIPCDISPVAFSPIINDNEFDNDFRNLPCHASQKSLCVIYQTWTHQFNIIHFEECQSGFLHIPLHIQDNWWIIILRGLRCLICVHPVEIYEADLAGWLFLSRLVRDSSWDRNPGVAPRLATTTPIP